MSDRSIERVTTVAGGGAGTDVNVVSWGGVAVAPAAAKVDGQPAADVVPEVGARVELFNGASWDNGRSGFVGPITAPFTGYQNILPMGVFNAVAPVLLDGQAITFQFDVNGNLKTVGGGSSASVGLTGAPVPGSADYAGFLDAAGNLEGARVYDTDSGAGTEWTLGANLRFAAPGGSVEAGTLANPLRIDPTGTTTQPVSQATAANLNAQVQGTAADGAAPVGNPVLIAGFDGAAVQTLLEDTSGRARVVGAAAAGAAVVGDPVRVGASDGATTRDILSDAGGRLISVGAAADGAAPVGNPVLIAGFDGAAVQTLLEDTSGRPRVVGAAAAGAAVAGDPVRIGGNDAGTTRDVTVDPSGRVVVVGPGTAGAQTGGVLTIQGDPAGTPVPVSGVVASSPVPATAGTDNSVAQNVASVLLVAANVNRKGLYIRNDSTAILYIALSAGAATTANPIRLVPQGVYEMPPYLYTGIVNGIWDAAGAGNARIEELT